MLFRSRSPASAVRVRQKDGDDTSFCRNLKEVLVGHLSHVKSPSNPHARDFEPDSLLLSGLYLIAKWL